MTVTIIKFLLKRRWQFATLLFVLLSLFLYQCPVNYKLVTLNRYVPVPYQAPVSKVLKGIRYEIITREVPIYVPTQREAKIIEKSIKTPIPPGDLLTIVDIKPLPEGGKAIVTLPLEGPVNVTISPQRPRFFEWRGDRALTGWYELTPEGTQASLDFQQHLFRVGPAVLVVKAEAKDLLGQVDWRLGAGLKVSF